MSEREERDRYAARLADLAASARDLAADLERVPGYGRLLAAMQLSRAVAEIDAAREAIDAFGRRRAGGKRQPVRLDR